MNKLITALVLACFCVSSVLAQNHKWEIGPLLGVSYYQGDLVASDYVDFRETNFGFGFFVRNNVHPNISLRANVLHGTISGNDNNSDRLRFRGVTFSSPLTEGSVQLEFDFLGHRRYNNFQFKKTISPYIFAGFGFALVKQKVNYNTAGNEMLPESISRDLSADADQAKFAAPIGAGIKVDLSDTWTVGAEMGWRAAFTDFLDGISHAGNPESNDAYIFGGVTVAFRFGEVDTDGDGVVDSKDRCPETHGYRASKGCPDIDQDGLMDDEDACPYTKGYSNLGGCPDRDKDGIADHDDDCPNEAGFPQFNGCPIRDSDGDGVADEEDACPEELGLPERKGCPFKDTDSDGLEDYVDECPDEIGFLFNNGCPDRDNDRVVDKDDLCPEVPGTEENAGCPELSDWESKLLQSASRKIIFENENARIKDESYIVLNRIAEIMQRYQQYHLRIEGYTDDQGNDFVNQQISERMAKACYDYLVLMGIGKDRVTFKGFGENKPVSSNSTLQGRAANQRVEFVVYNP